MNWQVVFAVIAPRQVLPNLVAGAIAEAGANQAGDMMQARPYALPCNSPPRKGSPWAVQPGMVAHCEPPSAGWVRLRGARNILCSAGVQMAGLLIPQICILSLSPPATLQQDGKCAAQRQSQAPGLSLFLQ